MLNLLSKSLRRPFLSADGECELSRALSTDVGAQSSADLAYYREHAARMQNVRASENLHFEAEKARRDAMKPAERDMLKPVFQDPINDPRGD